MANTEIRQELNRLYWESDASVSEIADQLDISRRALYDGIEPRPVGSACPECGAPLGFRNRTALESGEAECAECGYETEVEPAILYEGNGDGPDRPAGGRRPPRRLPAAGSAPVVGSAFVAGLAFGALVTYLVHRS